MKVRTTRFGEVEIDPTRLLVFPHGLLGFARFRTFALLQPDDRGVFYWLQSIEDPELAFVVTDPTAWATGYTVPIRAGELTELGLERAQQVQLPKLLLKPSQIYAMILSTCAWTYQPIASVPEATVPWRNA